MSPANESRRVTDLAVELILSKYFACEEPPDRRSMLAVEAAMRQVARERRERDENARRCLQAALWLLIPLAVVAIIASSI